MAVQKSFVLYDDYWQYFEDLTIEERGEVLTAIFEYRNGADQPQSLTTSSKIVFKVIRKQLDLDSEKYQNICERNKKNSENAGRKSKDNPKANEMPVIYDTCNMINDTCNMIYDKCNMIQENNNKISSLRSDIVKPETDLTPEKSGKEFLDYDSVLNSYHELCHSLPKVVKLTDSRKKKIKSLFKKGYTLEDFKRVFYNTAESSFLCGASGNGWKASFDWLINETNFVKVLEGQYQNRVKESKLDKDLREYLEDLEQKGEETQSWQIVQ